MPRRSQQRNRDWGAGIAAVVSSILWLACTVIGVLADADGLCIHNMRFAIFHRKTKDIFKKWMTDITPAVWTFGIREFIYTWNMLWVAYCVAVSCRPIKGQNRTPSIPVNVFPTRLHVFWSICSVSHAIWMILWDREEFVACLFVQIILISSSVAALITSHKFTYRLGALLQYQHPWDLWVSRTLVQNGIIILATWHLFLVAINSVILLSHKSKYPLNVTSLFILGAFGVIVLIWSIVELCALDVWLRYTFSFYPTVLWSILGVAVQHFYLWSPIFIASLVIVGFCIVILIIRVPIVIWRSFNDPLYIEQTLPYKIHTGTPNFRQQSVTTIL